ncbi:hypothetical protein BKA65DRAFT_220311 [Rhexocercosporidium sp. MPI-PUGE-AT-0058]|nr:hypothetical protein BKA65DRAFT_220311 [Rhexocercosporidium sp. MPI-PUGE-AT-0058]
MVKRKSPPKAPKTDTKKKAKPTKPSRLLSLPPEIRNRIYKTVVTTDLILLYGETHTNSAPISISTFGSISLDPNDIQGRCSTRHQEQQASKNGKYKRPKGPGALSWLRTSRQVYNEAKSIVYANLRFHVCGGMVFSGLINPPRKSLAKFPKDRSLSFCLKATIEYDQHGFRFSGGMRDHGWETGHGQGMCCCPFCFAVGTLEKDFEGQLMKIRELDLRIYFHCKRYQDGIGTTEDWAAMPGKLLCVDSEEKADGFVKTLCEQMPLKMFMRREIGIVNLDHPQLSQSVVRPMYENILSIEALPL